MSGFLRVSIAAIALAAAAPASAAVLYSENFDSYTPALNFVAFNAPGMVSDGTVDVVSSGSFSIDCIGGAGNCLDLDGSTGNSGVFSFTMTLDAGDYELSYQFSGNQRGGANDDLQYALTGFAPGSLAGIIGLGNFDITPDAAFSERLGAFTLFSEQTLTFSWSTSSNDNIGPVLDNILLTGSDQDVPEPAMLGLFGLGLIGIGAARRR